LLPAVYLRISHHGARRKKEEEKDNCWCYEGRVCSNTVKGASTNPRCLHMTSWMYHGLVRYSFIWLACRTQIHRKCVYSRGFRTPNLSTGRIACVMATCMRVTQQFGLIIPVPVDILLFVPCTWTLTRVPHTHQAVTKATKEQSFSTTPSY
jgi:hypothetical protein